MKSKVDKIEWTFDSFFLLFFVVFKTTIFKKQYNPFYFFCLFR